MRRCILMLFGIFTVGGCQLKLTPPQPAAPRPTTTVAASFDRTWNAVIDMFGDHNIPIAQMERSSGFIATERHGIGSERLALTLADCGSWPPKHHGDGPLHIPATTAVYNVIVRPAESSSTVRVTVAYMTADGSSCESKGGWEATFEESVKKKAQG